jgi:MscS family membrane protein
VWSLRLGPRDLLLWQWAALPLVLVAALALARVLASLTVRALERVTRRTWPALSESIPTRAKGPITGLWVVPLGAGGAALLGLYPPAQSFVDGVFRAMLFTAVFWGIWRSVGLLTQTVLESAWARAHPSSETLVPLGSRALKVVVVALAVTAVLSSLGYPVASLVAGLGIGGLAFALAAQKTGEHLFGSVAIGLDQPFRVGDFVKVEDHSGTVESLGLRSTRMRTQDRTVVTIPNGKLADLRVENFSQRDRYHFNPKLHVAPDGDPAAMGALVEALRALLTAHPQRVETEDLLVFVREIHGDSVVVEAQCWFTADDWNAWLPVRTALLLKALAAVQAQGLRLVAPPRPPPPPPKA